MRIMRVSLAIPPGHTPCRSDSGRLLRHRFPPCFERLNAGIAPTAPTTTVTTVTIQPLLDLSYWAHSATVFGMTGLHDLRSRGSSQDVGPRTLSLFKSTAPAGGPQP